MRFLCASRDAPLLRLDVEFLAERAPLLLLRVNSFSGAFIMVWAITSSRLCDQTYHSAFVVTE
jgi:hypothetical protein